MIEEIPKLDMDIKFKVLKCRMCRYQQEANIHTEKIGY